MPPIFLSFLVLEPHIKNTKYFPAELHLPMLKHLQQLRNIIFFPLKRYGRSRTKVKGTIELWRIKSSLLPL